MLDWDKLIPARVKDIKPSGIRKFFDIVGTMPGAISLGVGEPDFVTPYFIREEAIRSLQRGATQYSANRGLLSLRKEIADYEEARFGVSYEPESEVLVTVGGSEAIDLALRALCAAGDEVLIPEPCFVSYAPCVTLTGATPVAVPTVLANEFRLTADALEAAITPRSKVLVLSYPNNPTGAVMGREDLEAVARVVKAHGLVVISDEIYAELTYGGSHVSFASVCDMRERTVVVSGFSKAFAMTGWRLGYALAPAPLIREMTKIHQYAIMCAPTMSQYAALAALRRGREDDYAAVSEMREDYNRRRRLMHNAFKGMGLACFEPKGAFYMFPSVEDLGVTGEEFAEGLLKAKGVAVVPGSAFGEWGKYHIRACYAVSVANLTEAFARMKEYVDELRATKR